MDGPDGAGSCPACGAGAAKPIFYGMPMPGDVERLRDHVLFAGCCIPSPAPAFSCRRCAHEWGSFWGDQPEPVRDVFAELDDEG